MKYLHFLLFVVACCTFGCVDTATDLRIVELGDNVTFPCKDISTLKFNKVIVNITSKKYSLRNEKFYIYNISDAETGFYECDKNVFNVRKAVKPYFVQSLPDETYLIKNQEAVLNCSVKSIPLSTISWYKDGILLANDFTEKPSFDTVKVGINFTPIMSAEYTCQVSYSYQSIRDKVFNDSTRVIVYKFGNLSISVPHVNATSISVRLNLEKIRDFKSIVTSIVVKISNQHDSEKIVDSNEKIVKFTELQPSKTYTFIAYEKVGNTNGPRVEVNSRTEEAAPSKPRNIQEKDISSSGFTVTWEKPDQLNGIVREFFISYAYMKGNQRVVTNETKESNSSSVREFILSNLYAYVSYNVSIKEKTIAYSKAAVKTIATLEGVPHAPIHLNVTSRLSRQIKVEWSAIPSYLQGGILHSYNVIYSTKNPDIELKKTVSKNMTSAILNDLKPFIEYTIKVRAINTKFNGVFKMIKVTTAEAPPSAPEIVYGIVEAQDYTDKERHHFVKLRWKPPKHKNGIITEFQIKYRIIKKCNTVEFCLRRRRSNIPKKQHGYQNVSGKYEPIPVDDSRRMHTVSDLQPFSLYEFQVREKTMAGWGNFSNKFKKKTKEGNPSAPLNVTYTDLSENSITFSWKRPLHPNGIISSYKVYLRSEDGTKLYKENTIAPSNFMMTFNGLESGITYQILVTAFTNFDKLRGKASKILHFTTKVTPTGFPWYFVLIGCLATVLLIAVVIAVFLLVTRRRDRYEEVRTKDIDMTAINKSKVIQAEQLKSYCVQQHANSDHGFQQEFESVRIPTHTFTWEHSLLPYNQSKNRYSNIVAYDHSRVILNIIDNDPGSDYINANYIDGYQHPKKYIATQGPLPETVLDFWRMIWEQECQIIVMLTKLVEDNKMKCEQYWPQGKALQYKDIVVTVTSVSEMTDYVLRVFTLHKINNPELGKREVRQFHYTVWPDHGVPSHPTSMLSFVRHVMGSMNSNRVGGPIVVHCSAGVGRTGTFIAIENSLRQIQHDQSLDVYGTVCKMRLQRNFMVQIESQYTFIYDAILDSVICGNTEILPSDLVTKIRFLNQVDHKTGKTHFYEEFKRLESGLASSDLSFGDASHMENKQKNRYLNILPFDNNRVKLVPIAGCRQSDYINASIVDGFQQRNAFIATQAPLENTVTDFWRMVQERNIRIIVMLTKLVEREQEKCYLYWPQAGTVSYGTIYVELVNVQQEEEHIVMHELRLTNKETGKSWMVSHFMFFGWPDTGSPKSGTELINLIGHVQRTERTITHSDAPTLVHCSGGVGRTGVFIAVFNSIEKLKAKNVVDVFQTIRQLRLQRVAMVQTLDQYIFCYQALKDYLDSFDLYTNVEW